jgi:hypothetical protein
MAILYINYTTDYGTAPSQVSVSIEDETEFTFTEAYLPMLVADGYQFDGWMLDGRLVRVGDISNVISIDTTFELIAHWTVEKNYWGNASGGFGYPKSFVIVDEDGNELTGVVTDEVKVFTATDNDVRTGVVYASENGVSTGVNDIPAYHTSEGKRIIKAGAAFSIPLSYSNAYDYTALQAIICAYNTSSIDSVAADRVVINDSVYPINSIDALSSVEKDALNKTVNLSIVNETENKFVLRYFTYREM